MAPKKPTKKKGQSKAGTSKKTGSGSGNGGGQNGLAAILQKNVVDRLIALQKDPGRDAAREQYLSALVHPASPEAIEKWKQAGDNATAVAAILQAEDLFPWIHPYLSACAFESIFAACVHCWLTAPEVDDEDELNSSVRDYVRWQVRTFVTAVGGDRKKSSNGE